MVRLATGKTEDESPESGKPSDVPVMAGTHFHALDDKFRVIIPAKLRPALGERFWLMRTQRNNIGIYPHQTGLDIIRQAEERQADNPDDDFLAIAIEEILSSAELVENVADSAWRVPIPDILRLYAGLEKEVVTVGVLNHAELWDREKWVADQQDRMNHSEEIAKIRAGIMRAGASGTGRKKQPEEKPVQQIETAPVTETAVGTATGTDGNLGNGRVAPAASAGDGKRSKSVLSFDNIGKTGS